jgi:hypothetical protein
MGDATTTLTDADLAQQKTPRTLAVELEKNCITLIGANPQGWVG